MRRVLVLALVTAVALAGCAEQVAEDEADFTQPKSPPADQQEDNTQASSSDSSDDSTTDDGSSSSSNQQEQSGGEENTTSSETHEESTDDSSTTTEEPEPTPSLELRWQKILEGDPEAVDSSPSGTLFAVSVTPDNTDNADRILVLGPEGDILHTIEAIEDDAPEDAYFYNTERGESLSINDNGRLAVGTNNGNVHIYESGSETWQTIYNWDTDAQVDLTASGSVLVGSGEKISLLSSQGDTLWTYRAGDDVRDVEWVSATNECWAASADSFVYKLDCDTGDLVGEFDAGRAVASVDTAADGKAFVVRLGDEISFSPEAVVYDSAGAKVAELSGLDDAILHPGGKYVMGAESKEFTLYTLNGTKTGEVSARDFTWVLEGDDDWSHIIGSADDSRIYLMQYLVPQ